MTLFLALLLAHLVADFMLQRRAVIEAKARGLWTAWLEHGALHWLAYEAAVGAFAPADLASASTHALLGALALAHQILDWAKTKADRRRSRGRAWLVFSLDQVAHVAAVAGTAVLLTRDPQALARLASAWAGSSDRLLAVALTYSAVIFGAGYFNAVLLQKWSDELAEKDRDSAVGLPDAGLYIGWLERALVTTAVLFGSPEGAGLVAS